MNQIGWGIIGPGKIAHTFARAVASTGDGRVVAVGSRDVGRAAAFAGQYNIPGAYGSYEETVIDPAVDVVYVATPHAQHAACMRVALGAGKPVLCEKAFTINARQAGEVIALAREKGLFLMEAMWTRFLPLYDQVRIWLQNGEIGRLKMIESHFSMVKPYDPTLRAYDPYRAGGALLDVGIYNLTLAAMCWGTNPLSISTHMTPTPDGVDDTQAMILDYGEGRLAVLTSGLEMCHPNQAFLIGTTGYIRIPRFWEAKDAYLGRGTHYEVIETHVDAGRAAEGFVYEIAEVHRCLRAGLLESPRMPLSETLAMLRLMDRIRGMWGMKYPDEL